MSPVEAITELLAPTSKLLSSTNWLWNIDLKSVIDPSGIFTFKDLMDAHSTPSESIKVSTQFKGVVPQLNGKWGAQIYEKNQRIWLGTFNKEEEAAQAYDRAAIKYRGSQAATNFSRSATEDSSHQQRIEDAFLKKHTKEEVVDMLRRHTFGDELEAYAERLNLIDTEMKKNFASNLLTFNDPFQQHSVDTVAARGNGSGAESTSALMATDGRPMIALRTEHLFDKSLTPSDVGKLNRLVVPKQYAEKYFPLKSRRTDKGIMLTLQDSSSKMWRFRYSYWASSQSYVFTKGWSAFVKEKKLKAGDMVTFKQSLVNGVPEKHMVIICKYSSGIEEKPMKGESGITDPSHSSSSAHSGSRTTHSESHQACTRDLALQSDDSDAPCLVGTQTNEELTGQNENVKDSPRETSSLQQTHDLCKQAVMASSSSNMEPGLDQESLRSLECQRRHNDNALYTNSLSSMPERNANGGANVEALTENRESHKQSSKGIKSCAWKGPLHYQQLELHSSQIQPRIETHNLSICGAEQKNKCAASSSSRVSLRLFGVDMELGLENITDAAVYKEDLGRKELCPRKLEEDMLACDHERKTSSSTCCFKRPKTTLASSLLTCTTANL